MVTLGFWAAVALAGCGGGQLAGSQASAPATTTTSVGSTALPPPASTPATTGTRPTTRRSRTTERPTTPPTRTTRATPPAATTTAAATPPKTTPAPPSGPTTHVVDEQAEVTLVQRLGTLHYIQRGHVSGTFDGELTLETKPSARGGIVTFTVNVTSGGTVSGRGVVTPNLSVRGKLKPVTGSAVITGGTGKFAGISGRNLVVSGKAALDGSRGFVRLTGVVEY